MTVWKLLWLGNTFAAAALVGIETGSVGLAIATGCALTAVVCAAQGRDE